MESSPATVRPRCYLRRFPRRPNFATPQVRKDTGSSLDTGVVSLSFMWLRRPITGRRNRRLLPVCSVPRFKIFVYMSRINKRERLYFFQNRSIVLQRAVRCHVFACVLSDLRSPFISCTIVMRGLPQTTLWEGSGVST